MVDFWAFVGIAIVINLAVILVKELLNRGYWIYFVAYRIVFDGKFVAEGSSVVQIKKRILDISDMKSIQDELNKSVKFGHECKIFGITYLGRKNGKI
jgi:hypothetical protein